MKLALVPCFQYMDSDEQMVARSRSVCLDILSNSVAHDTVVSVLNTLSALTHRSLTHIDEQVRASACYQTTSICNWSPAVCVIVGYKIL